MSEAKYPVSNQDVRPYRDLSDEEVERERAQFEEAAFNARFLSSIVRNEKVPQPKISGCLDFISEGCPFKADFVARNEDGTYKEASLNPAWWAWQKRAAWKGGLRG